MIRRGLDARFIVARRRTESKGIEQISYVRGVPGSRRLARWVEATTGRQYIYSPSFRELLGRLPDSADVVHLHSLHGAEGYADLDGIPSLSHRTPTVVSVHDLWLLTGHCAHPLECVRWQLGCGHCPDLGRYPAIPRDGTRGNWKNKRRQFRRADVHLIVPSNWVERQVRTSPILGHLPVSVVHNPLDTRIFHRDEQQQIRGKLGLPTESDIVLLAAKDFTNVYKGTQAGIDAMNAVSATRSVLVMMLGSNSERALQQFSGPSKAIPYQSNQSDLADYYRAADILLVPSRAETFGMVAAEAMACGTPVVGFATGGLMDVVGDEGGVLVDQGDVQGLAAAVRALLDHPAHRRDLADRAAARAHTHFGLATYTDKCLAIYERLTERHRTSHIGRL